MAINHSTKDTAAIIGLLQSPDLLIRNEAVNKAIQIGRAIVPALLQLGGSVEKINPQIMYALAQISDPGAQDIFLKSLQNKDEFIRAYAAMGLVRINHPKAIEATLQTLNDAPDELHLDITPSVQSLGEMGFSVVPSLLNLLRDKNEITRLHSQRSLEMILDRYHRFIPGKGFPSKEDELKASKEWIGNGNYNYHDSETKRELAIPKLTSLFSRLQAE